MTPWKELLKEIGLIINITHSQGLVHEFEVHPAPITSSDRCQSAVRKWKTNLIEKIGTFHFPQQLSVKSSLSWRKGKTNLIRKGWNFPRQFSMKSSPKKGKTNVIGTWLSTPVVSSADKVENKADRKAGTWLSTARQSPGRNSESFRHLPFSPTPHYHQNIKHVVILWPFLDHFWQFMIIVQWEDSRITTIRTHGEADLSVLLGQLLELHARAARVTKKLERQD